MQPGPEDDKTVILWEMPALNHPYRAADIFRCCKCKKKWPSGSVLFFDTEKTFLCQKCHDDDGKVVEPIVSDHVPEW